MNAMRRWPRPSRCSVARRPPSARRGRDAHRPRRRARRRGRWASLPRRAEGGRLATEHLLGLGHRRIAFIGEDPANDLGFSATAKRERAYLRAMADAGLAADPGLVAYC